MTFRSVERPQGVALTDLRVCVLGDVRVERGGVPLPVKGAKRLAVLAFLALRAPHVVSRASLLGAVWAESAPDTADNAIQVHISTLRGLLGRPAIVTSGDGYRLGADVAVDLREFEAAVSRGTERLTGGDAEGASSTLRAGLAMWTGPALHGLREAAFADLERGRLESFRLVALEHRLEADIQLGRHHDVEPELEALVTAHPLREQLRALLMECLYRCGRQAEALQVFETGRVLLREELGVDPSPTLREAQRLVLAQAPQYSAPKRIIPTTSVVSRRTALPVATTSLVGREEAVAELQARLVGERVRLLTLTGPGGSGKTRLAVALASRVEEEFADGVYFVPLESVTTTEAMWSTIAEVLGVTGEGRAPPTFLEHLARRRALLVLDNLEQLDGAASVVSALLAAAPGVQLLATSRRPLHVVGEHEQPVPPLSLPPPGAKGAEVAGAGAVQLFVQRARMVRPSFTLDAGTTDDVVEICRALDGLPLALELAAARVKLLGARAVRTRLDRSLELAGQSADLPDRQRTLRATIEWSHALLAPHQRRAFRQLGVFSGPFDAQAAAAVLADGEDPLTHIAELLDVSLVEVTDGPDGEPRVHLLQTISAFAREQLVAEGELEAASRRHAEHYLQVAAAESTRLRGGDYLAARDRIEADLDNYRAALTASLAREPGRPPGGQDLQTGLGLCERLAWFWYACGYQAEGRRYTELAVDAAAGQESPELMKTLHMLGVLMLQHGQVRQGREVLASCLAFWRRHGDARMTARELNSLGVAARTLGEHDNARALLFESAEISRRAGDPERLASALSNLSTVECDAGRYDRALGLLHEARALDAERGDAWGLGVDDVNLALVMLRAGDVQQAGEQLRRHAASAVALGDPDLSADVLALFCCLFAEGGDAERAARMLGAMQALRRLAEQPMPEPDAAVLARSVDKVRGRPTPERWQANLDLGAGLSVQDALAAALAAPLVVDLNLVQDHVRT